MQFNKILIDLFGCDHPKKMIAGVCKALNEIDDIYLVVTGKKEYISEELKKYQFDTSRLEIVNAEEIITNEDNLMQALMKKKDSSLIVALKLLKERNDIKALITAGNTGAVIVGSSIYVGRQLNVSRPTLATLLPGDKNGVVCLTDCGANIDCSPQDLVNFAQLGSDYMKASFGIENPKIGLLSLGVEDTKGNALTKETFKLLRESDLNFVGNIEARNILSQDVDVVVCDGFAGNVVLKNTEGTSISVIKRFMALLKKYAKEEDDFTFVNSAVNELNQQLDLNSMGGAVILGIEKLIIKAHGSANENTIVNTIKQALKSFK